MKRIRSFDIFSVGFAIFFASSICFAQQTTSTETYTYDALGRLQKVEVNNGAQDGAARDYQYDKADNRSQVVSVAGGTPPLPSGCALSASNWPLPGLPVLDDTQIVWPRASISSAFNEELILTLEDSKVSGTGLWALGGFQAGDNTLGEGTQGDTLKLAYITPVAASVPSNEQLVLNLKWKVTNFSGPGTEANSTITIDGTGQPTAPSCTLSPVDFTVPDGTYAWPRVYAPTSSGCGENIELAYTITVQSPSSVTQADVTDGFFQNNAILGASDHTKMVWINPSAGLATSGSPVVLHVNWQVVSGNAVVASPGHSVVTITAD